VLPGDTLWSIAAERLETGDMRRIARYWPRIHRANREEIGPNPNLIRPGQVLELPPEHA
jgi:nucleoid-associated protein YgaU